VIYDLRTEEGRACFARCGSPRLADAATGTPLVAVFYYDTETHVLGRWGQDFDGAVLAAWRYKGGFKVWTPGEVDDGKDEGGVDRLEIWEIRELKEIPKRAPGEPRKPATMRMFDLGGLRLHNLDEITTPDYVRKAMVTIGFTPDEEVKEVAPCS
jgi:hypothetical protein